MDFQIIILITNNYKIRKEDDIANNFKVSYYVIDDDDDDIDENNYDTRMNEITQGRPNYITNIIIDRSRPDEIPFQMIYPSVRPIKIIIFLKIMI